MSSSLLFFFYFPLIFSVHCAFLHKGLKNCLLRFILRSVFFRERKILLAIGRNGQNYSGHGPRTASASSKQKFTPVDTCPLSSGVEQAVIFCALFFSQLDLADEQPVLLPATFVLATNSRKVKSGEHRYRASLGTRGRPWPFRRRHDSLQRS